jgi:valyl-tRNA synthetase
VFLKLYEKGYIYKGYRINNWCPDCQTTLSDAEVDHEEKEGNFWHIKYFIKDSDEYLEIATTRPETLIGDTAVAVNPEDDRYKHLIGKTCILPVVGRELLIVGDEYVDVELGTGALKVTPAHDPNDFEIGKRHNLEQIIVMNEDATMNNLAGKYEGMDRYECRKALVKELEANNLLVEVKPHDHNVGTCYRCHTVIEPMLSDQWFVQMEELAKPANEAVKNGDMKFVPDRFDKIYYSWMDNVRDWCISRQLWWGHRIPAFYCDTCKELHVVKEMPDVCTACGATKFTQDPDVLDTWFSSALWPFSTLGWPEKTPELDYFYPTNVLVTGYDIIFFWVARMLFSGLEQMGEVPFADTLIHGLVRADDGRKMSKSFGNGIDPLDVIDQYGADALRFMLCTGNSPGNDFRFYMEKVEASRNFANKLWNASRFVLMGLEDKDYTLTGEEKLELSDKWILSKLNVVIEEATTNLDKYELGIAASGIYEFVWDQYCDWYIELSKKRLWSEDEVEKETAQKVLVKVLKDMVKLLHPFMPFITEEIWSHLPNTKSDLITAEWPVVVEKYTNATAEKSMTVIMEAIKNVRNVRAEMDVKPSRKAKIIVTANEEIANMFLENSNYFEALASASELEIDEKANVPEDAIAIVTEGAELFLPLADLVDFSKEIERLEKEQKKLEGEVERVVRKLANQGFVAKAPEKLINAEKEKQAKYQAMLDNVLERIEAMKAKI